MFINILGIFILVLGFSAPYLQIHLIPYATYFWVGFLFLLKENEKFQNVNTLMRYGKAGLLFHILAMLFFLIFTGYFLNYLGNSYFFIRLFSYSGHVAQPTSILINKIMPDQSVIMADGTVVGTITYKKIVISSFFNSLFYISIGMFLGKIISKRKQSANKSIPLGDESQL